MSHKFVAGAGLLVLAGWGISGLAVAGSDIKQVDLTLRILVDGPPPCSVKGSAVKFGNVIINRIDGTNTNRMRNTPSTAVIKSAMTYGCSSKAIPP